MRGWHFAFAGTLAASIGTIFLSTMAWATSFGSVSLVPIWGSIGLMLGCMFALGNRQRPALQRIPVVVAISTIAFTVSLLAWLVSLLWFEQRYFRLEEGAESAALRGCSCQVGRQTVTLWAKVRRVKRESKQRFTYEVEWSLESAGKRRTLLTDSSTAPPTPLWLENRYLVLGMACGERAVTMVTLDRAQSVSVDGTPVIGSEPRSGDARGAVPLDEGFPSSTLYGRCELLPVNQGVARGARGLTLPAP